MSARQAVVAMLGGALMVLGTLLLFLPGPGLLLIGLGIMVLSMEFAWAKNAVNRFRAWLRKPRNKGEHRS